MLIRIYFRYLNSPYQLVYCDLSVLQLFVDVSRSLEVKLAADELIFKERANILSDPESLSTHSPQLRLTTVMLLDTLLVTGMIYVCQMQQLFSSNDIFSTHSWRLCLCLQSNETKPHLRQGGAVRCQVQFFDQQGFGSLLKCNSRSSVCPSFPDYLHSSNDLHKTL